MMCRSTSALSLLVWMQFFPNYRITLTWDLAGDDPDDSESSRVSTEHKVSAFRTVCLRPTSCPQSLLSHDIRNKNQCSWLTTRSQSLVESRLTYPSVHESWKIEVVIFLLCRMCGEENHRGQVHLVSGEKSVCWRGVEHRPVVTILLDSGELGSLFQK
jgi:hypothetical protein